MRNKNILITGGAGFIGSHLADYLIRQNSVTIIDNLSSGKKENLNNFVKCGGTFVEGDICKVSDIQRVFKKIDIVFHLAVQCVRLSFIRPQLVHEVNTTGTLNLLEMCRKQKIKRFIYVSSSEIYGTAVTVPMSENHQLRPTTIYGASKLAGEYYSLAYMNSYKIPVTIVRPFNTYGPRSHFEGAYGEVIPKFVIRLLNNEKPVIYGDGNQTRDFTYISDTIAGLIKAGNSQKSIGQIINIAYGKEVSINKIATIIATILNKKNLKPDYKPARPADINRLYAKINLANNLLGFYPTVSIAQGLKVYIDWVKQYIDLLSAKKQLVENNWL